MSMKCKKKKIIVFSCLLAVFLGCFLVAFTLLPRFFADSSKTTTTKPLDGNDEQYSLNAVQPISNSAIAGYHILFLGASVTYGSASFGESCADYITKRGNATMYKEAVSGTTMVDGENSFIRRLEAIDTDIEFDLVVCQLATNDATRQMPLGVPAVTDAPDRGTVCGAIEYIIQYVRKTWNCPIVFYTGSYYESKAYAAMVEAMREISLLYDVGLIDLYTDREFNAITDTQRKLYMADDIHPKREGYLMWWTPKMEEYLQSYLESKK